VAGKRNKAAVIDGNLPLPLVVAVWPCRNRRFLPKQFARQRSPAQQA